MRWWPLLQTLLLLGLSALPTRAARAQAELRLATLEVQLWPEYDQPSMLVLYDFVAAEETTFPASLTFQIPAQANLIAVAVRQQDALLDAAYEGPVTQGEWQAFTVNVDSQATYRIEYYQPLAINGATRSFTYLWEGTFGVDAFTIEVLQPPDVTSFSSEPSLQAASQAGGLPLHASEQMTLEAGDQFSLRLEYDKTSDALVVPPTGVQPASPVDADTPGRVSVQQVLPYLLAGSGLVVLSAGVIYYAFSGRRTLPRRRRRPRREHEEAPTAAVYCPQCGTRAQPADHFCRVCGARLGG